MTGGHPNPRIVAGDVVYWHVQPGPVPWETEGVDVVVSVAQAVAELRDGRLVGVDEVELLKRRGFDLRGYLRRLYAVRRDPTPPVDGDDADYLSRYLEFRRRMFHPAIAAVLAGTVEVCIHAATRGQLLPAVLRLEQRQVKRAGEAVKKFAVPILDIQVTPAALGLVVGSTPQAPALEQQGSSWTPIEAPAPRELGVGDTAVGDAIRDGGREPAKRRKNSPPELPPTGLNPRGAPPADDVPPVDEPADDRPSDAQRRMAMALFKKHGMGTDADRLAATSAWVGREITSSNELTRAEMSKVIDELQKLDTEEPVQGELA